MPDIHVAVTRHVKPGLEDRFDELLRSFVQETMTAQGVTGVHLLRPPTGSESREFGILRSFDDESSAEQFYGSARFKAWSEQVADLVEGQPSRRRLSGLEAFFRAEASSLPPRWKMAVVTFLGVFPSVLLWSNALPSVLPDLGYIVTSIVVNASVVATLTWIVMPLLTRVFHGWLHR